MKKIYRVTFGLCDQQVKVLFAADNLNRAHTKAKHYAETVLPAEQRQFVGIVFVGLLEGGL